MQGRTYGPRTTFVSGVGEVPSGPRSWLAYFGPRQGQDRLSSPVSKSITIKQEDIQEDSSMFAPAATDEHLEHGEVADHVKTEETDARTEPAERGRDYQNIFSELLARQARSTRTDTSGSIRQNTTEGRLSRSDTSVYSTSRDRSRSPDYSPSSRHTLYRSRSDDSMFFFSSSRASRSSRSGNGQGQSIDEEGQSRSSGPEAISEQGTPSDQGTPSQCESTVPQEEPPRNDAEEMQDNRCQCPIGHFCAVRTTDCLDCRPLVREYASWTRRCDEEAFER